MIAFALLIILQFPSAKITDPTVVSFVYHRFGDNRYPSTNTSTEDFEGHLRYLKESNISVKSLSEAMKSLSNSSSRSVVITIDDGYLSFYKNGYPLLKKYGLKASLFINTASVGKPDFMSWKEIKEVSSNGIEIGNHSNAHEYFLDFDFSDVQDKFIASVDTASESFIQNLGYKPAIFAYPYGEYSSAMELFLKEDGFNYAMMQNSGVTDALTHPLRLPRFSMTGRFASVKQFKEKVAMNSLHVVDLSASQNLKDLPSAKLQITDTRINPNSLQCFIQGSENCKINIISESPLIIAISPSTRLTKRRTLCTVTAQSKNNNEWHWFSKIWIRPDLAE